MDYQAVSDAPVTKSAWRLLASNLLLCSPAAETFAFDSSGFGNRLESSCRQQTYIYAVPFMPQKLKTRACPICRVEASGFSDRGLWDIVCRRRCIQNRVLAEGVRIAKYSKFNLEISAL